ncbi:hypothetical protein FNH22_02875 [Fulvivirga sp. M361]|uniref:hypothetical protein n=1 Tax=Fulvivirga sp. M361 TaxID=2594266 RepID=UPI00117AC784|nr:hypothetical protein [Fulvivirga sp. M361]TRX61738.1 hypothetical protein FNH22_02875 [Fulvivirga sp. M361]
MKKVVQAIFLLLILIVPVVIFLFLKTFGDNKFFVPVYHQDGVTARFDDCDFAEGTFTVPLNNKNNQKANITVFFEETADFTSQELVNISKRLKATFSKHISFNAFGEASSEQGEMIKSEQSELKKRMHCNFATDTLNQFILHDQKGYIRGYYNNDLDEIDRLIVEIKIVLENE